MRVLIVITCLFLIAASSVVIAGGAMFGLRELDRINSEMDAKKSEAAAAELRHGCLVVAHRRFAKTGAPDPADVEALSDCLLKGLISSEDVNFIASHPGE